MVEPLEDSAKSPANLGVEWRIGRFRPIQSSFRPDRATSRPCPRGISHSKRAVDPMCIHAFSQDCRRLLLIHVQKTTQGRVDLTWSVPQNRRTARHGCELAATWGRGPAGMSRTCLDPGMGTGVYLTCRVMNPPLLLASPLRRTSSHAYGLRVANNANTPDSIRVSERRDRSNIRQCLRDPLHRARVVHVCRRCLAYR